MSEFNIGRAKGWSINSSSNLSPFQTDQKGGSRKSFDTSMNAIAFGLLATAILISMFIVMAIYEHLFKPNASHGNSSGMGSMQTQKLRSPEMVQISYASDVTVVMPGQHHPTFIAHPAPMPCQREGVYWPSHEPCIP